MRIEVAGNQVYAYTGSRPFDPKLETMVFVHGAANDHGVWALQSRYFAHHGRNVLAVDLPGHGRSGGGPLASVRATADWLVALLDALRIPAAAVTGHSMGSLAALDAAGRHPERIAHLALLAPAVPMRVAEALLDAARRDDHVAFEMINGWSFSPGDQLGGNRMPGVWMTGNGMRLMERLRPGALYADLLACHTYDDGLAAAADVRCPTLVVLGERDQMAPPRNAASMIAALRDKRTLTIPDCGHSLMVEAPDSVLDALREFAALSRSAT
jgi:pimeloyl-ACP methyl ester carboxylesterase